MGTETKCLRSMPKSGLLKAEWGSNQDCLRGKLFSHTATPLLVKRVKKKLPSLENAVKVAFGIYKHTHPVYKLRNATRIIALIVRGTGVHSKWVSAYVIIL